MAGLLVESESDDAFIHEFPDAKTGGGHHQGLSQNFGESDLFCIQMKCVVDEQAQPRYSSCPLIASARCNKPVC